MSEWRPPDLGDAQALFYGLLSADGFAGARRVLGSSPRDPRVKLLEDAATKPRALVNVLLAVTGRRRTREVVRGFGHIDTDTYWRRVEALADYRARVLAAMGEIDLVLSPASPLPALRHGASAEVGTMGVYASIYNTLGWPAGIVPLTKVRPDEESDRAVSKDPCEVAARETERASVGLPIGVQLAARPWQDHVVLAAMSALERKARAGKDFPVTPV